MLDSLDLEPQEGDIWPDGQVHIFGLEQNPSPQECRQMAANQIRNLSAYEFLSTQLGTGLSAQISALGPLALMYSFTKQVYQSKGTLVWSQ